MSTDEQYRLRGKLMFDAEESDRMLRLLELRLSGFQRDLEEAQYSLTLNKGTTVQSVLDGITVAREPILVDHVSKVPSASDMVAAVIEYNAELRRNHGFHEQLKQF